MRTSTKRRSTRVFAAVALGCLLVLAVGCTPAAPAASRVGDPVVPAAPKLDDPESAVRSYLDWVTYSYRMANSELSSPTMTPWEGVRVDSYIELNRQKGLGLDQRLTLLRLGNSSIVGTQTLVPAYEEWEYRYFSLKTLEYRSVEATVSYDATYALVQEANDRWLVDKVEAKPRGEVK